MTGGETVALSNPRLSRTLESNVSGKRLRCPTCRGSGADMILGGSALQCAACGVRYPVSESIVSMMPAGPGGDKEAIKAFWHELFLALHADGDMTSSRAELMELLEDLEAMFRKRQHLAVTEMPLARLKSQEVLEIGSGNGAHSALFGFRHGARMMSVDITLSRVLATSQKLDLLSPEGDHLCLQADAESLPFSGETFDIVYSNGVLHHTPDTAGAVREVHRVLRPGGLAVVMLYARHSFEYWINLVLGKGILLGGLRRGRGWLGRSTEWMAAKPQTAFNPLTKVYSVREVRALFSMFHDVRVRKNSFQWRVVPIMGKLLEGTVLAGVPKFPGGRLVYGHPFRAETPPELWLGRYVGFGLNIVARK